jgi:hypothetical protein
MLRREPREVYRLYDEEEFLSGEELAPEAGFAGAPARDGTQSTPADGFERSSSMTAPLAARRRHRRAPAMVAAAGLGAVIVASIEMHASVGRLTRPLPAHRFQAPRAGRVRTSRRVARRPVPARAEQAAARPGTPSSEQGRVAPGPRRGGLLPMGAAGSGTGAAGAGAGAAGAVTGAAGAGTGANPPAPPSPAYEFGFEQ